MSLGGAQNIGDNPADSMHGAKTTDQTSTCYNQDNMTIAKSLRMTIAILASCQKAAFIFDP
jgi:hypothetical protein